MMGLFRIAATLVMIAISGTIAAHAQSNIDELIGAIHDKSSDPAARMEALDRFRLADYSGYVDALSGLVSGDEERFAVYAAEKLVDQIVMVGAHRVPHIPTGADASRHDMEAVQKVKMILRENVLNPYPEVRDVIVPYLVSRGDPMALESVRKAIDTGLISHEEAFGYAVVAPPDFSGPVLRSYAEADNEDLAQRAISVLSSDTSQQAYVRERILVNAEEPESRRAVAFAGLAKYDASFTSYATDPKVIDLAVQLEKVPGAEHLSGSSVIVQKVQLAIDRDPKLWLAYMSRLMQTSKEFAESGADNWRVQAVDKSIIQKLYTQQ